MTHDELLKVINNFVYCDDAEPLGIMLKAVVELHKPKQWGVNEYQGWYCSHCGIQEENEQVNFPYPCSTIQAIEKEL